MRRNHHRQEQTVSLGGHAGKWMLQSGWSQDVVRIKISMTKKLVSLQLPVRRFVWPQGVLEAGITIWYSPAIPGGGTGILYCNEIAPYPQPLQTQCNLAWEVVGLSATVPLPLLSFRIHIPHRNAPGPQELPALSISHRG